MTKDEEAQLKSPVVIIAILLGLLLLFFVIRYGMKPEKHLQRAVQSVHKATNLNFNPYTYKYGSV